jgi:pimeloyl-ACP methyl ester carboxylesterase
MTAEDTTDTEVSVSEVNEVRTLTTIGTPVQGFTLTEKWTKGWPLVLLYRLLGPAGFITKTLSDSLLDAEAVAAQPDQAATIMESFRSADRKAMLHATRSMMLHRNGIEDLLGRVAVPTLVMPVRDGVMGWRPDEARRTCAAIRDRRVEEVAGTGHISPLLIDRARIERLIGEFWSSAVPGR